VAARTAAWLGQTRSRSGIHWMDTIAMALEVIELSDKHRRLLARLSQLVPDLDPQSPQSLQRIFGLGLIALTMRVASRAREQDQQALVDELGAMAREMVEAEDWG